MTDEPVLVSRADRVSIITLNRPEVRNAMNRPLVDALIQALKAADGDDGIGAVVLTGADPVFCAGADLKEMAATDSTADMIARVDRSREMYGMIARMRTPVIAAVNGHAVAGGCGLAMACDLVIAAERAEFGYPEVQRDLVAALVMVTLSRLVGRRAALEILLTGRRVPAPEALSLGMVNRVVPKDRLMEAALELAASIASRSKVIVGITKELFHRVADMPVEPALDRAAMTNVVVRQYKAAEAAAETAGRQEAGS